MNTKLSKEEKQNIKDRTGESLIDEKEWAELMGMTASEIRDRNSGFGDWIESQEEKDDN